MSKKAKEREAPEKPTPEQRAEAFKYLLGGLGLGLLLVLILSRTLDPESQSTALWHYGRYGILILFGWMGHSIGIGRGRVVAENLECLAIAVVMALILKHFLIEAYKIPTGSMQPTILGNDESAIFDRVLVNKFSYLIDEPERYDVIVFKYPLDRSKNYIKRLIGLGGERVVIQNGDIHVAQPDGEGGYGPLQIARKPAHVRDSVMKLIYPSGRDGETFDKSFEVVAGEHTVDRDTVSLGPDGAFRFGRGEAVRDSYLDGYDPDWGIPVPYHMSKNGSEVVSDLSIGADVTPEAGCEEVRLTLYAGSLEHRAVVRVGDSKEGARTRLESGHRAGGGDDQLLPFRDNPSPVVAEADGLFLSPGRSSRVTFLHVDQMLQLAIDGEVVLEYAYEIETPPVATDNEVKVSVRGGGGASFSDIEVARDIHYLTMNNGSRQVFDVPEGHLLALGDNTQNSSDGRQWAAEVVRFADGREVIRERKRMAGFDPKGFIDIYGERHRLPGVGRQPSIHDSEDDSFGYVPRELLLGKALAVFWPIVPHFRWKLIR